MKGTTREYLLELPRGYDGKAPVPVMFAFHGSDTNPHEFIDSSGYGNVSEGAAGRVLIVGPRGVSRGGLIGWLDFGSPGSTNPADVDFFDALVEHVKASYCVDPKRIFSMGHSAGGFISNHLACIRSDVLRGIGPFAGGGPDTGVACGAKVAAFIVHNPKEGDATECGKMSGGTCPWVVEWNQYGWPTTQYWTEHDGCDAIGEMPTAAFAGDSTTGSPLPCKSYPGCSAGYPVTLCLESYTDQWDGPHAFPVQWGAKAVTDFFLTLPPAP